jgi:hypothetical protein
MLVTATIHSPAFWTVDFLAKTKGFSMEVSIGQKVWVWQSQWSGLNVKAPSEDANTSVILFQLSTKFFIE